MARTSRTAGIHSKAARAKLEVRREPHWAPAAEGVSVGYRRVAKGAGSWIVRTRKPTAGYTYTAVGKADDLEAADGDRVLSFAQAQERAREILKPAAGQLRTVDEAARAWARGKVATAMNPQTARNHKAAGERLARAFEGERIATLTKARLVRWRDDFMASAGDDPDAIRARRATWNREVANLKSALTRAAGTGPWADLRKFQKTEAFGARVDVLTGREIGRLLGGAEDKATRDLLELLAETGCRYSEIAHARVRDADVAAREWRVTGKTGLRVVTLSERATALVAALVAGANDPSRYLLRRPDGQPWAHGDQLVPTRRAFEQAGLPQEPITYTLRHSAISRWLAAGVPIGAVAAQAGTSVAMIESTYAKWIASDRQRWFG